MDGEPPRLEITWPVPRQGEQGCGSALLSASAPMTAASVRSAPVLRLTLLALAATQMAIGLWQAIDPGSFYDALANFGPRSDHALRDTATFYLAAGIALYVAANRPAWRVPVLTLVGLQYAFHTVNHLIDVGDSDPSWVGWFDFASLAGAGLLIAWALREAAREELPAALRK